MLGENVWVSVSFNFPFFFFRSLGDAAQFGVDRNTTIRPHCSISDEIFYREVSLPASHYRFLIVNDHDRPTLIKYYHNEFHMKRF